MHARLRTALEEVLLLLEPQDGERPGGDPALSRDALLFRFSAAAWAAAELLIGLAVERRLGLSQDPVTALGWIAADEGWDLVFVRQMKQALELRKLPARDQRRLNVSELTAARPFPPEIGTLLELQRRLSA